MSEKWLSYLRPHYSQNLNANFLLFNQLPFLLYHNCFISTDTPNDKHMANLFSVMKWYPFVTVTSVLTLTVVYLHLCETLSTDHFFQEPWITRFILFWMLTILFPFLFFSFCLNTLTTVKEYTGFTIKTPFCIPPAYFTCTFNLGPFCRKPSHWRFFMLVEGMGKAGLGHEWNWILTW